MVTADADYDAQSGSFSPGMDASSGADLNFSIPTAEDLEDFRRLRAESDHMLRLAPDIFAWLLSQGPDWERRADAILRREMMLGSGI